MKTTPRSVLWRLLVSSERSFPAPQRACSLIPHHRLRPRAPYVWVHLPKDRTPKTSCLPCPVHVPPTLSGCCFDSRPPFSQTQTCSPPQLDGADSCTQRRNHLCLPAATISSRCPKLQQHVLARQSRYHGRMGHHPSRHFPSPWVCPSLTPNLLLTLSRPSTRTDASNSTEFSSVAMFRSEPRLR